MVDDPLERAARILAESLHAVALTGAGISVPSGIPDFRSPESGLWSRVDPMEVAAIWAFRRDPTPFFRWFRPLLRTLLAAEPNPAHRALARLEAMGVLQGVITQNIDGLHQAAGSRTVWEVHGHLRTATCLACGARVDAAPLLQEALEAPEDWVPRCTCGGVLKPDVVLFGEDLPFPTFAEARRAARYADVLLVAGSSLTVAPAGDLPYLTLQGMGQVIVVNLEPTWVDPQAAAVIRGDVAQVLPELAERVARLRKR